MPYAIFRINDSDHELRFKKYDQRIWSGFGIWARARDKAWKVDKHFDYLLSVININ
jgi:hypothetical protein